jgi:diguanylate cyclase (GGDEF)-like protein
MAIETARDTSGLTARLVLVYAQRAGGRPAVEAILRACDAVDREAELMDEHAWISYELKIRLFETAADVLGDPDVMLRIGGAALELNTGAGLKLALKALGSPALVYRNVVAANARFSRGHRLELLEAGRDHARLRFVDLVGRRYHPLDCQYTRGLLTCVPLLFGQPMAEVRHSECGAVGADGCVFEVRWDERGNHVRFAVGALSASALGVALAALLDPSMLPLASVGSLIAGGLAGGRVLAVWRRRVRQLAAALDDQVAAADRLSRSLQDLVSELRLEDLLAMVTDNARAAIGGKDFALLLAGEDGLRCQSSSGLPDDALALLEQWANATPNLLTDTHLVDDVAHVETLRLLGEHPVTPVRSLCCAPLVVRGTPLGVLLALASQPHSLLPRDVDQLRSYAVQAGIAVFNARLYHAQRHLASHDSLTGLLNRHAFHETLAGALGGTTPGPAIILADLNGFKQINDHDGHGAGDRLLARIGAALRETIRDGDHAYRVGGDEFAVLLPRADEQEAHAVAARVRRAIDEIDARTSASIGVAVHPVDGADTETLLARADERLYDMKRKHHATYRPTANPARGSRLHV